MCSHRAAPFSCLKIWAQWEQGHGVCLQFNISPGTGPGTGPHRHLTKGLVLKAFSARSWKAEQQKTLGKTVGSLECERQKETDRHGHTKREGERECPSRSSMEKLKSLFLLMKFNRTMQREGKNLTDLCLHNLMHYQLQDPVIQFVSNGRIFAEIAQHC